MILWIRDTITSFIDATYVLQPEVHDFANCPEGVVGSGIFRRAIRKPSVWFAEPDDYLLSLSIDKCHEGDLVTSLLHIFLIDTHCICPQKRWLLSSSECVSWPVPTFALFAIGDHCIVPWRPAFCFGLASGSEAGPKRMREARNLTVTPEGQHNGNGKRLGLRSCLALSRVLVSYCRGAWDNTEHPSRRRTCPKSPGTIVCP